MKKALLLIMSLLLIITVASFVACGGEDDTTAAETTTAEATEGTTGGTDTSSETVDTTTEPVVTTTEPVVTTTEPVVDTEAPTANMRDPAKTYHIESQIVKTNSKGEDRDDSLACYLIYSNAGENLNERYADGEGVILYEADLSSMIEPSLTFKVRQQYAIYIIDNMDVWEYADMIEIANFNDIADRDEFKGGFNENGAYTAGTNTIDITINPYDYGYYGVFYIYIVNCNPEFGWGGTVMQYSINQYVEGEGEGPDVLDDTPGVPNYKDADAVQQVTEIAVNGYGDDEDYIFENTSASTDTRRYCDGTAYLIYRIEVRNMIEPTFELYVTQNYKIEISPDGKTWTEIANFATSEQYSDLLAADASKFHASGDYLEGDNWITIEIDPYNPTNGDPIYGALYIRVSDCFPAGGWGGAVEKLTIKHYGLVAE